MTFSAGSCSKSVTVHVVEVADVSVSEGTEIDDGDNNPDTKAFVVCKANSGEVTITARPNPGLTEAQLAGVGCWTVQGGMGDGKLTRTVSKTAAGSPWVEFRAGSSSKRVTVHVVEVAEVAVAGGCEVDDGDGNPSTRAYVVKKAPSGALTVTATPNPALAEAQLAGTCWTTTGGEGTGLLTRTVPLTVGGETVVTFRAGDSMREAKICVLAIQTETVVAEPPNRERTVLGVGEGVRIRLTPDLPVADGAMWSLAGEGQLSDNLGSEVVFTAPATAAEPTVTASIGSCTWSVQFSVITPSGVVFEYFDRNPYYTCCPSAQQPYMAVGYWAVVYLEPDIVNFYNVRAGESAQPIKPWLSGWFETHKPVAHIGYPDAWEFADWEEGKGTILYPMDSIGCTSCGEPPFENGAAGWDIPWVYSVDGSGHYIFGVGRQRVDLYVCGSQAEMTVRKGDSQDSLTCSNSRP